MKQAQTDFIRSVDLFANLSAIELEQILPHFHLQTGIRGETLFLEGYECRCFFIIIAGRVRLYETSPDGKEQSLFVLKARDFFDIVPLIDNKPHPVSAEAMTDIRLYKISFREMIDLVHRYPTISASLLPYMSQMMRQLAILVGDLSFASVATRLGRLILEHAEEEGVSTPLGIYLPWGLTHREIAQLIGTTREVVTRILHNLEQEGILRPMRGELIIEDLEKLVEKTSPTDKDSQSHIV